VFEVNIEFFSASSGPLFFFSRFVCKKKLYSILSFSLSLSQLTTTFFFWKTMTFLYMIQLIFLRSVFYHSSLSFSTSNTCIELSFVVTSLSPSFLCCQHHLFMSYIIFFFFFYNYSPVSVCCLEVINFFPLFFPFSR
jgi:hypothetical protein